MDTEKKCNYYELPPRHKPQLSAKERPEERGNVEEGLGRKMVVKSQSRYTSAQKVPKLSDLYTPTRIHILASICFVEPNFAQYLNRPLWRSGKRPETLQWQSDPSRHRLMPYSAIDQNLPVDRIYAAAKMHESGIVLRRRSVL